MKKQNKKSFTLWIHAPVSLWLSALWLQYMPRWCRFGGGALFLLPWCLWDCCGWSVVGVCHVEAAQLLFQVFLWSLSLILLFLVFTCSYIIPFLIVHNSFGCSVLIFFSLFFLFVFQFLVIYFQAYWNLSLSLLSLLRAVFILIAVFSNFFNF